MKHFIKLKCIVVAMLLTCSASVWAQGHWTYNPEDYQYDMTVYAKTTVEGVDVDPNAVELAAFVGDECRGVAEVLVNPDNSVIYYLRVRSYKDSGEKISFKLWDGSKEIPVYPAKGLIFESQAAAGMPSAPLELTDVKPFTPGDVNDDGEIDVLDVTAMIAYILGNNVNSAFLLEAADLNEDGEIDILDVTRLISIILNN